jgi:tripartite-type tricarboxylate transporter receptor subunit TctC
MRLTRRAFQALAATAVLLAGPAWAQSGPYPTRPITMLIGYPPGGSTDLTGRTVADELARLLKTTVVVENLGGAGGALAAQKLIAAPADGYTLMVGANNELIINQHINRQIKYDGLKDFTPIGLVASQPLVLVASPKAGVKTTAEFVEKVRRQPGQFSYGSSGVGTSLHLAGELVKERAGLDLVHVPYRGVAPLTTDLLGNTIEYGVYVLSSGLPHIRAGKVTALGTTEAKRSALTPEIPALSEHPAMKDIDVSTWFMQVEQEIGILQPGPQLGGAAPLQAAGRGHALKVPLAVEVFLHKARSIGRAPVEAVEGGQVAQGQGQLATAHAQATGQLLQKAGHRPGTAQLVAVDEGRDGHLGARLRPLESPDAFDAGVARAPAGQVGGGQQELGHGHQGSILATSAMRLNLADSAAMKARSSGWAFTTVDPDASSFWRSAGAFRASLRAVCRVCTTG